MTATEKAKFNLYNRVVKMFTATYLSVYTQWKDELTIVVKTYGIEVRTTRKDVFYDTDAVNHMAEIGRLSVYYSIDEGQIVANLF